MYQLDIKPVMENSFDCFQGLVASVASYYKRDFSLLFRGSWFFDLCEESAETQTFGSRIRVGWRGTDFEMLQKHHGIKLIRKTTETAAEDIDLISDNICAGMPIIVANDVFNCPWCKAYKKYRLDHYCLVTGYNKNKKILNCIDPYFGLDSYELPIPEEHTRFGTYYTFSIEKEQCLDENWKSIIVHGANNMGECNGYLTRDQNIKLFANQISEKLDFNLEKSGYKDDFMIPLFRILKEIGDGRLNFAKLMVFLAKRKNSEKILSLADELSLLGERWYRLRLNFMKISVLNSNEKSKEKLAQKLYEIAYIEKELAERIISI